MKKNNKIKFKNVIKPGSTDADFVENQYRPQLSV